MTSWVEVFLIGGNINLLKKDLAEIEVIHENTTGQLELMADPGMLEHALVNLIQNAIHATTQVQSPHIRLKSYVREEHVYIEIEDNGCGIPREHLEDIFIPSFTLKGSKDVTESYHRDIKGTGYGLANVEKYMAQHKGSITVASEFGKGTKFCLGLPILRKKLSLEEKNEFIISQPVFNKNILLVEDEPSIADVQYQILTQKPFGHKVDIAPNGWMAMELFAKQPYDLVSLDYILPGKMNGMDVYHDIRKSHKTLPILFISGNIEFLESIQALKGKDLFLAHLSKPFQQKEYLHSIDQLLKL